MSSARKTCGVWTARRWLRSTLSPLSETMVSVTETTGTRARWVFVSSAMRRSSATLARGRTPSWMKTRDPSGTTFRAFRTEWKRVMPPATSCCGQSRWCRVQSSFQVWKYPRGRTVTIRTLPGAKNCRVEGGELLVPPRFDADGLRGFYSAEVERVYYPLCREYAKKMGVALPPLVITKAKGKWGSCSPKVIRLNFRLAMIDPYSAEGVIVHELSHITVHDHSPRFYAYMAKYMPDHAERKSRLRKWEREDAVFTEI